jgi:hypothetical protein
MCQIFEEGKRPSVSQQQYSEQETIRCRDEAVCAAPSTPPKPLKERIGERKGAPPTNKGAPKN